MFLNFYRWTFSRIGRPLFKSCVEDAVARLRHIGKRFVIPRYNSFDSDLLESSKYFKYRKFRVGTQLQTQCKDISLFLSFFFLERIKLRENINRGFPPPPRVFPSCFIFGATVRATCAIRYSKFSTGMNRHKREIRFVDENGLWIRALAATRSTDASRHRDNS